MEYDNLNQYLTKTHGLRNHLRVIPCQIDQIQFNLKINLLRICSHFHSLFFCTSDRKSQNVSIFWQRTFILQPFTKEGYYGSFTMKIAHLQAAELYLFTIVHVNI